MDPAGSEQYDLEEGTEWRFELEENEAIAVRVSLSVTLVSS
jgi:hypothetical protein